VINTILRTPLAIVLVEVEVSSERVSVEKILLPKTGECEVQAVTAFLRVHVQANS
jgi:hypothetical protein